MKNKEIPVLLLTGYLGSGKTTLVNKILSNERGIKFAVIVNDIGEVNIDADLIQKGGIVDQKDDSLVASKPAVSASRLLSHRPSVRYQPWGHSLSKTASFALTASSQWLMRCA